MNDVLHIIELFHTLIFTISLLVVLTVLLFFFVRDTAVVYYRSAMHWARSEVLVVGDQDGTATSAISGLFRRVSRTTAPNLEHHKLDESQFVVLDATFFKEDDGALAILIKSCKSNSAVLLYSPGSCRVGSDVLEAVGCKRFGAVSNYRARLRADLKAMREIVPFNS